MHTTATTAGAGQPDAPDSPSRPTQPCPHSDAEDVLWRKLRAQRLHDILFRRDAQFGSIRGCFFAPRFHLVVQVNDAGVDSFHWLYARQDAQLRHMGFRVLRFTDREVHNELPFILDSIVEVVSQIARRQGRLR